MMTIPFCCTLITSMQLCAMLAGLCDHMTNELYLVKYKSLVWMRQLSFAVTDAFFIVHFILYFTEVR